MQLGLAKRSFKRKMFNTHKAVYLPFYTVKFTDLSPYISSGTADFELLNCRIGVNIK